MTRRLQKFSSEATLHQQVADYLRLQYPNVMFRTDFAAGIKMTLGQATKHKRLQSGRAWPDLFIAEPRYRNQRIDYYGLFLELKKEGTRIIKRDGEVSTEKHIQEQYAVLNQLKERGYMAEFAVGFEQAKQIIDDYLKGDKRYEIVEESDSPF